MAWKLRKDKLQAKSPQEETNDPESTAPPLEDDTITPAPILQTEAVAPPLPEPVNSSMSSPVEQSDTPVSKEVPASGLKWRSRSSQAEAPPVDEQAMPVPIEAEAHPFLPPEASPATHKFSPLDFRETPVQPAPPSGETDPEEEPQLDVPAPLEFPQTWGLEGNVEEPNFAPLDFTQPIPLADADISAEEHAETSEEPLFSPMPTPGVISLLPPNATAHPEPQEEPFFPLPPLGDNPFLAPITEAPATEVGQGSVEEPHFPTQEPLAVPAAEIEEPLFTPLPDWNPFPLLEATAEPEVEDIQAEAIHPAPLTAPEINPFPLPEAIDSPPAFPETPSFEEPPGESEPQVGDEAAELSPFAPYQPQEHTFPAPVESEAALPPVDVEQREVVPLASTAAYDAPPAFAPEPAFVTPNDDGLDVEREAIASSLILPETGTGIPRVAPFIVDVPPPVEEVPLISGTLTLRIGKLSANYPVTREATVIGRPDSKVQSYPDIEIELDDAVSRRHAEVRHHDDAYFVVDLMSTNGTMLNGEKLDPYKEYPLTPGDRIRIGDRTELVFG